MLDFPIASFKSFGWPKKFGFQSRPIISGNGNFYFSIKLPPQESNPVFLISELDQTTIAPELDAASGFRQTRYRCLSFATTVTISF